MILALLPGVKSKKHLKPCCQQWCFVWGVTNPRAMNRALSPARVVCGQPGLPHCPALCSGEQLYSAGGSAWSSWGFSTPSTVSLVMSALFIDYFFKECLCWSWINDCHLYIWTMEWGCACWAAAPAAVTCSPSRGWKGHFQQFHVNFSPKRRQMCSSDSPDSHSVKQLLLSAGSSNWGGFSCLSQFLIQNFHRFKVDYLNSVVSTPPKEPQAFIKS